jgi:hypothetical protein
MSGGPLVFLEDISRAACCRGLWTEQFSGLTDEYPHSGRLAPSECGVLVVGAAGCRLFGWR